jgi:DNA-binding NarL/FixJ family response regulator
VERIRVLIATMPRLQAGLIRAALAAEPAIEVVAEVGADELAAAVLSSGVQVAIVDEGAQAPSALELLAAEPRLKVFGVAESGRRTVLYECRPAATPLGEVSPRLLVQAILRAVRAERPRAGR